jgi:hypothetical protein
MIKSNPKWSYFKIYNILVYKNMIYIDGTIKGLGPWPSRIIYYFISIYINIDMIKSNPRWSYFKIYNILVYNNMIYIDGTIKGLGPWPSRIIYLFNKYTY